MNKINRIQQSIMALEGGAFQKLFDAYLYKKFGFTNIQPLGVQAGTNKPTKGIPDSYVYTEDGKYILICYGNVKEQPAKKIKKDILECFDSARLCVEKEKIEKIICGHGSSNLHIEDDLELRNVVEGIPVELVGIGTLSYDLALRFPNLAFDHLQISVDTHQIFDIDDFVSVHDRSGTNAPLSTTFYGREKETQTLSTAIEDSFITVVTGPSGIGKTRLVLEVCRTYKKAGWKVYGIKSNSQLLYQDLSDCFDQEGQYLLFFDDANSVTSLENILDYVCSFRSSHIIKIVLTVRDYVKKRITDYARQYSDTTIISVDAFTDDEIQECLKKSYNIQNWAYLQKISEISNGNIRLATLAGIRAVESGYIAISNSESIFKNYYGPIMNSIELNNSDIILLSIIALLGPVKNDNPLYRQLRSEYVSCDDDNQILEKLCDLELVDWYKNEVVMISDQSFGNYLLYYVLYEKKWINLQTLIHEGLNKSSRVLDALHMLQSLFCSSDLQEFLCNSINSAWEQAGEEENWLYLRSFYLVNPIKALQPLQKYVDEIPEEKFVLNQDEISKLKHSGINCFQVEILAGYYRTEYYDEALGLILDLYKKQPRLFWDIRNAFVDEILFDKDAYYHQYVIEQKTVDTMWKLCIGGKDYNYTELYICIASKVLETMHHDYETVGSRKVRFLTFGSAVCNELIALRRSVIKSVMILYDDPRYHRNIWNILREISYLGNQDDQRVLLHSDYNVIYSYIQAKEVLNFEDAAILSHYRDQYLRLNESINEDFQLLERSYEYFVYELLTGWRKRGYFGDERKNQLKSQIRDSIKCYQLRDYKRFFEACNEIQKIEHDNWEMGPGIGALFQVLEGDNRYLDILELYLTAGAPFGTNQYSIICYALSEFGYQTLFDLINKVDYSEKEKWINMIWLCLDESSVDKARSDDYCSFLHSQCLKDDPIILPFPHLMKYIKYNVHILEEITECLMEKPHLISSVFDEASNDIVISSILEVYKDQGQLDSLKKLYFLCDNDIFDYEGKMFWELYSCDPVGVWELFAQKYNDNYTSNHYNYARIFEKIWKDPTYADRIDEVIKCYYDNGVLHSGKEVSVIFAKSEDDPDISRKKKWLFDRIERNTENINRIDTLYQIILMVYPEWRIEALLYYLNFDLSVDHFKKIYLFPIMESWSGSEIPLINNKVSFLKNLDDSLRGKDFINHKAYIQEMISALEKQKNNVEINEYIEDNQR